MKNLYLIPTPISQDTSCIPPHTIQTIQSSTNFICERIRTSRRFIKAIIPEFEVDKATFIELDKRNRLHNNADLMQIVKSGSDLVFMSEAGSPCIADPGTELVDLARKAGYNIHPLSGPSSIMLALMASGMNGQNFTFNGYLSVKKNILQKEIKNLEKMIGQTGYTQIFIETPYRNVSMYDSLLNTVTSNLKLHISQGIYTPEEDLMTKSMNDWKNDLGIRERLGMKIPTIFILGK